MKFFRFGDFFASSLTRRATCAKVPRRAALAWFSNKAFDFDRSSDWLELSAYQNAFEILSLVASCFRGALPPDPFLAVCFALAMFQKLKKKSIFFAKNDPQKNGVFNFQKTGMSKIVMKLV